MTKDTGGPAFPIAETRDPITGQGIMEGCGGMTLRDWFAGQAMIGLYSTYGHGDQTELAQFAYEYADAMLAERSKP